ncbi:hypothetical protein Tco_0369846 [Tanacetum coccineum]
MAHRSFTPYHPHLVPNPNPDSQDSIHPSTPIDSRYSRITPPLLLPLPPSLPYHHLFIVVEEIPESEQPPRKREEVTLFVELQSSQERIQQALCPIRELRGRSRTSQRVNVNSQWSIYFMRDGRLSRRPYGCGERPMLSREAWTRSKGLIQATSSGASDPIVNHVYHMRPYSTAHSYTLQLQELSFNQPSIHGDLISYVGRLR